MIVSMESRTAKANFSPLLLPNKLNAALGSGSGSVGRVVTYDTRDPWFKSQHRQSFINQL